MTFVELQKIPTIMRNFSTVNCQIGLSFYPVNTNIENPVSIYDLNIINAQQYDIKRNSLSGLILVDPKFNYFNNMVTSGIAPIQIRYSTNDIIIDEESNPIINQLVSYHNVENQEVAAWFLT